MARDSILGWMLIFLVGASLFLSFSIWHQTPGVTYKHSPGEDISQVDLAAVLGPERILVRFGDSTHTLLRPSSSFYNRTWALSREILSSQWSQATLETSQEDQESRKRGIVAWFSTPLPASSLRRLIDATPSESSSLEGKLINSFTFTLVDHDLIVHIEDDGGQLHKFTKSGDSHELKTLLHEISDSRPPMYARLPSEGKSLTISHRVYVSLMSYELPTYSVVREDIPEERQVAEFFADFSVVRRIEEKDGAIIYTDGQRGLRVNDDGTLEYSFPGAPAQKKTTFYDALSAAVNFVNRRGGWPKSAYLYSYDNPDTAEFTFEFRSRINGYPVIGERDYITVTVGGTKITRFYRNVNTVDRQTGIKSIDTPVRALDISVAVKNIRQIDDIYPAYRLQGRQLQPVWVVKTGGIEVILPNSLE